MASNRDEMLVKEATVQDLVSELRERCSTLVFIAHVPDDADVCDTLIIGCGNKAACLGLATIGKEVMLGRVMNHVEEDTTGME